MDSSSASMMRRSICPVCRTAYIAQFAAPPSLKGRSDYQWPTRAFIAFCKFTSLLTMLPFLASPSTPLGFTSVGAVLALAALIITGKLQELVGFRLCLVVDDDGMPVLRFVRVGAAIDGLAAGALLVATDAIGGGIFSGSVVLITRHDEHGTVGYIVNQPVEATQQRNLTWATAMPPLQHALAVPNSLGIVEHGCGGPVGLESWEVLHAFRGVTGASHIGRGVWIGGDLSELRDRIGAKAQLVRHRRAGAAARPEGRGGGEGGGSGDRRAGAERAGAERATLRRDVEAAEAPQVCVHVLYGYAAWSPGQLEGEIRSQLWTWAADAGLQFALGGNDERGGHETWERAFRVVEERRDAAFAEQPRG